MKNTSLGVLALVCAGLAAALVMAPPAAAVSESDISVVQEGRNLIVTVDNPDGRALAWQYAADVPADDCGPGLTAGLVDGGRFAGDGRLSLEIAAGSYCFKITDEDAGNDIWYAYRPAPADNRGPGISVRRGGNNLLAISSRDDDLDPASWRYGRFDYDPACETVTLERRLGANASNSLILREVDNGNWYCFKASDTSGNATFFKYRVEGVDTTAPAVVIAQSGRLLAAEAEEAVDWHYVFSPSDIDCGAGTFLNNRSAVGGNPVTLTSDRIGYYYCFRATDRTGNAGFGKYRVESIDFLAPKISLEKVNLTVRPGSDQAITEWHYVKSGNIFDCGRQTDFSAATDFSARGEIELDEDDHLDYFCVRGLNETNIAGFARLRADTRIPDVRLELDETSIAASSDRDGLAWEYLKTETEPGCDHGDARLFEDESNYDKHKGNSSRLSELDNGSWFCFRAVDGAGGNYGYAKQQISGITAKAPGAGSSPRGQLDVLVITAVLVLAGGGFLGYVFVQKKKQLAGQGQPAPRPAKRSASRKRRKRKDGDGPPDNGGMVQPLDYLKRDDEE